MRNLIKRYMIIYDNYNYIITKVAEENYREYWQTVINRVEILFVVSLILLLTGQYRYAKLDRREK